MNKNFLFLIGTLGTLNSLAQSNERPNILWITFEDTSAYEFGCYGNKDVHTPNSDSLASKGVQFMNAWSVAPQSSPARSSLITGCYATTFGMDIHPVPQQTPPNIFFPQLLRDNGYYCTNNSKTHYNSTTDNSICWDECSKTASYNSPKRKANQPFFAVFNSVTSHMGRIRTFHTDGRRDYTKENIYTNKLTLPKYTPDLPEVRSDYAGHLESVQDVDQWLGFFLKDLKDKKLDENTIIFFFSDHGGCLPRGKGYLYESGLKVPLIVYFPPKWKHLAGKACGKNSSLVNFTDLGPTTLSLIGVKPPKYMQGKAIFGKYADKSERKMQFAIAGNQLHHFMPVRAESDGRYKYICTYIPYRQFVLRNYYQWGMPSNQAWDKYALNGCNYNPAWNITYNPHPAELLFDLENDPDEINNLSDNPAYADKLIEMRKAMSEQIRNTVDLGFFLPSSRVGNLMYDKVRKEKYPLDELYNLVEKAKGATINDIDVLTKYLKSPLNEMRFWAIVGISKLANEGVISKCVGNIEELMNDADPYIAAEAAYACAYLGKEKSAISHLINPVNEEYRKIGYSSLECLSLDKRMHNAIINQSSQLKIDAERLPRVQNEDAGLMARGILVNIGLMDINNLYGPEAYKKGLNLNHDRRPMIPLPF